MRREQIKTTDRFKEKANKLTAPIQSLFFHPSRTVTKRSLLSHQSGTILKQTIEALRLKNRAFFASLPMMNDEKSKRICDVLMRVSDASYMSGKFSLCQVCACSVALLTLEHGLCPASSYALASLGGGTVQYFQDYATSRHLSEMALFVQKRIGNGKEVGSQYAAYQFGLLWTTPFFHNRDVFYTVYLSGVRAGESDFSMWSLFSHLFQ